MELNLIDECGTVEWNVFVRWKVLLFGLDVKFDDFSSFSFPFCLLPAWSFSIDINDEINSIKVFFSLFTTKYRHRAQTTQGNSSNYQTENISGIETKQRGTRRENHRTRWKIGETREKYKKYIFKIDQRRWWVSSEYHTYTSEPAIGREWKKSKTFFRLVSDDKKEEENHIEHEKIAWMMMAMGRRRKKKKKTSLNSGMASIVISSAVFIFCFEFSKSLLWGVENFRLFIFKEVSS